MSPSRMRRRILLVAWVVLALTNSVLAKYSLKKSERAPRYNNDVRADVRDDARGDVRDDANLLLKMVESLEKDQHFTGHKREERTKNDKHTKVEQRSFLQLWDRVKGCRGVTMLMDPDLTIQSPNYPNDYTNFLNCKWLIEAPQGSVIDITFTGQLNIEGDAGSCTIDHLNIYDGENRFADQLVSLCGNLGVPDSISTTANTAYLWFRTDGSVGYSGFRLTYSFRETQSVEGPGTAACTGVRELTSATGTATSDGYPSNYADYSSCGFRIIAPVGHTIEVTFTDFVLELEDACMYDSVTLYDGSGPDDPQVGTYCGTHANIAAQSTSNIFFIKFISDLSATYRGFSFDWKFVNQETIKPSTACGDNKPQLLEREEGYFSSQGYNDNQHYLDNSDCAWRVVVPSTMRAHLHYLDFSLEPTSGGICAYDKLLIYDGSDATGILLGTYCGDMNPGDVTASGNVIYVTFRSDSSVTASGFKAQFSGKDKATPSDGGDDECKTTQLGVDYRGDIATTLSGKTCQAWDSQSPHKHSRDDVNEFPNAVYNEANYCRNPDSDGGGPWCYTTDPTSRWEYCNIPFCNQGPDSCGVPSIEPKFSRIVGGQPAVPHSWPWQVSIRIRQYGWSHWCGGSIIDPLWVITAAHCIHGRNSVDNFKVIVGDHNKDDDSDASQVLIELVEIILHESYDSVTLDNDIALLKLKSAVTYSSEVSPICLPSSDVPTRTLCVTTGWGATQGTADNTDLQQVQVPILDRANCNQQDWYRGKITPNMLCAGYSEGRKDSCQGDSGGPLVCTTGGPWSLHGLTSWGFGCAEAKKPGLYTKVTMYLDWVQSRTGVGAL